MTINIPPIKAPKHFFVFTNKKPVSNHFIQLTKTLTLKLNLQVYKNKREIPVHSQKKNIKQRHSLTTGFWPHLCNKWMKKLNHWLTKYPPKSV